MNIKIKTRSEWGTDEDWEGFYRDVTHYEAQSGFGYKAWFEDCTHYYLADNKAEARRLAVERLHDRRGVPLPWHPDYDLSTEEGCEEAIKTCGYDPDWDFGRPKIILYKNTPMEKIAMYDESKVLPPHLEHWQAAAQWAISHPTGDK